MQNNDFDIELSPPPPCLSSLDSALHQLGMLASGPDSRAEYITDLNRHHHHHRTRYLNVVHVNTRYVSNVSIGFRVRPLTPHVRYKPYAIKERRHRTRSENNDSERDASYVKAIVDDIVESNEDIVQLKKAKSLESIVAETSKDNNDDGSNSNRILQNIKIGPCPELEVVSDCIQNLRVAE